jgi:hypothetical protein
VFARTEARTSSRWQLGLAQALFNSGIGLIAVLFVSWPAWDWLPTTYTNRVSLLMLAMIVFTLNRRAITALLEPSPEKVQSTIKVLLLSYVMLDATLVFWKFSDRSPYAAAHALATAALVLPAMILSRFIPMT